jgi:GxxExxY protein
MDPLTRITRREKTIRLIRVIRVKSPQIIRLIRPKVRGKKAITNDRDTLQRALVRHHRRRHGGAPHPRPRLSFDKLRTGLEAVYQAALEHELALRGIPFEAQKRLAVTYKGQLVGEYIADLVVDGQIILELKAISALTKAHEAQAHNYPSINSGQASPPPACAWPYC